MAGAVVLTVDIGSSSVRARFYTAALEPVDLGDAGARKYGWRSSPAGAMECDATALLEQIVAVLDGAVAEARVRHLEVAGVAVTSFWHGVVGLDGAGVPLTPLFGWGDTRAEVVLPRLRERLGETRFHQRTGCFLHPSYPAVKLAWLRESEPAVWAHAAAWVSIGELIEQLFFGTRRCSLSVASATGLLEAISLEWDPETLEAVGLSRAKLSHLVAYEPLQGLAGAWRTRWPELSGVPWYPAVGDGGCANLGSGAVGSGRAALTVGTSAAVRVVWESAPAEPVPEGVWCYRVDGRRRVAGGALSNGGNIVPFLLGLFPGLTTAALDRILAEALPARHALTILPTLYGERAGEWGSERSAAIVGLRAATRAEDVAQAWLEAITYRIAELHSLVEARFGRATAISGSGGGLYTLPSWAALFADVLDRPVILGEDAEATSRGAALLAAEALGWIPSVEAAPRLRSTRFEPRRERHLAHRAAIDRQRELARALRPWSGRQHPAERGSSA